MFRFEQTVYFYCRWGKDGWPLLHQLIPIVPRRRRRRTGPNKRIIIRRCPVNATPVRAAMTGKILDYLGGAERDSVSVYFVGALKLYN